MSGDGEAAITNSTGSDCVVGADKTFASYYHGNEPAKAL
jgi:hypothetical protein